MGSLFGRVTVLQLMELSNPNHPLLHRLMREAPGTYYHSIIVGNLAERAAEVIGAGADGVAVVSAVMSAPDPAAACRDLYAAVGEGFRARRRSGL